MLEGFQGDTYQKIIEQHPAGRLAEVNDFLGLAIYLSTPASDYVTGQVIYDFTQPQLRYGTVK